MCLCVQVYVCVCVCVCVVRTKYRKQVVTPEMMDQFGKQSSTQILLSGVKIGQINE